MAEFWPAAGQDKTLPAPTQRLATFMNNSRKIVFSRTLRDASAWANSRVTDEPVLDVIAQEKSRAGKDVVVFAGANLAQSALRAGCVDEIWLLTLPQLFGHGTRLFDGHNLRSKLELLEDARLDTGDLHPSCGRVTFKAQSTRANPNHCNGLPKTLSIAGDDGHQSPLWGSSSYAMDDGNGVGTCRT